MLFTDNKIIDTFNYLTIILRLRLTKLMFQLTFVPRRFFWRIAKRQLSLNQTITFVFWQPIVTDERTASTSTIADEEYKLSEQQETRTTRSQNILQPVVRLNDSRGIFSQQTIMSCNSIFCKMMTNKTANELLVSAICLILLTNGFIFTSGPFETLRRLFARGTTTAWFRRYHGEFSLA